MGMVIKINLEFTEASLNNFLQQKMLISYSQISTWDM